jgi:hypothetical protein
LTPIITFYSHDSGTDHVAALVTTAWTLASRGHRVLVVDWDLESPGLHDYFGPYLPDATLRHSPGVIDLLWRYATAALDPLGLAVPGWHDEFADIHPFATSIDHEFPGVGTVDLVPAGRQGLLYRSLVSGFDWDNFYERLGGGGFLEALRRRMREGYDYVLLNSRAGRGVTAGVCTIQLPDILVPCVATDQNDVDGTERVVTAVQRQRNGKVRILPVLVHTGSRGSADAGYARSRLGQSLVELGPIDRDTYRQIVVGPSYAPLASLPAMTAMQPLVNQLAGGAAAGLPTRTRPVPAAHEVTSSMSLWLPVGPTNFHGPTANSWLHLLDGERGRTVARSIAIEDTSYVPRLQVSVLRRLLEVLPVSFGYEPAGVCLLRDDGDDAPAPVAVTMTLRPKPETDRLPEGPERSANLALVRAGVDIVTVTVDEHGGYSFAARSLVADWDGADADVARALARHMREVFGGDYPLDSSRISAPPGVTDRARMELPQGILTFMQANLLVEGLFNWFLSPEAYVERDAFGQDRGSYPPFRRVGDIVDFVAVSDYDGATPGGLAVAMRRFFEVTAREVLQRLRWSVDSVRRSLLDEMMTVTHRQSTRVQLDLLSGRASPSVNATESQLRAYVALLSARLPLVAAAHDAAFNATEHLDAVIEAVGTPGSSTFVEDVRRLELELKHWDGIVDGIRNDVQGLESAIEHAWRERLLYDQQQVRAEQEAMAEIERSRMGRPRARTGRSVYVFLMTVLTVIAIVVGTSLGTVSPGIIESSPLNLWRGLWPMALAVLLVGIGIPLWNTTRQRYMQRRGISETYGYEFSFRLDEPADPRKVYWYLNGSNPRRPRTRLLKSLTLNSSGSRVDRISPDRTIVKLGSVATFRVSRFKTATFEIINEILASGGTHADPEYVILQCRIFGDSPRRLKPDEIFELTTQVLQDIGDRLTVAGPSRKVGGQLDTDSLDLIAPLYSQTDKPGG